MNKLTVIGSAVILCGSVLAGCTSKSFVLEEIKESEDKTVAELSKQLKSEVENLSADINKRVANIEATYALKNYVDAEMSKREQEMMKAIDTRLEGIKETLKDLAAIKEETMMKLSQNLQSSVGVLLKQLNAQKEGLDIAIEELEKFIGSGAANPPSESPR